MTLESDAEKSRKRKNLFGLITGIIITISLIIAIPNIVWIYGIKTGSDNLDALNLEGAKNSFGQAAFVAKMFPQTDDRVITSLNILATVLIAQGNYEEAERTIDESLKISKERHGEGEKTVKPMLLKAGLNRRQGKYNEAIRLYEKVLKILDKKRNEVYANTLLAKSILEIYRGNYPEAEKGLKQVSKVNEDIKQNTINNVADITMNLGRIEEAKGNYKSAEKLYDRALEIMQPAIDKSKSTHALILNLKAQLLLNQNNSRDAEPLINKAFSLSQDLSATEYLQAANLESLLNLTSLYLLEGKYKRAEKIIDKSLPIARDRLGKHHPAYVKILSQKAKLLEQEGKLQEAKKYLDEANSLIKDTVGKKHRYAADQTTYKAEFYIEKKDYELARKALNKALSTYEQCLGKEHPDYAQALLKSALIAKLEGNEVKSQQLVNRAYSIFQKANSR